MNPKRAHSKIARARAYRLSPFVVVMTWMLLLWPGQLQAGEVHGVQTLAPLVGKIIQSVVGIKASTEIAVVPPSMDSGPGFPEGPLPMTKDVYGAGVIIKAEPGLIVTNNHLINGVKILLVRLSDGRQFDAKLSCLTSGMTWRC